VSGQTGRLQCLSLEKARAPGAPAARPRRKLFADDAAVKSGLLQVYVRVKPVARKLARCMTIERDCLVKAIWWGPPRSTCGGLVGGAPLPHRGHPGSSGGGGSAAAASAAARVGAPVASPSPFASGAAPGRGGTMPVSPSPPTGGGPPTPCPKLRPPLNSLSFTLSPPVPRKNKEALYKFSRVFPDDAPQPAIYAGAAEAVVADLLAGRQPEAVVMAYGVTSAGKTFTMQARARGSPRRWGLGRQGSSEGMGNRAGGRGSSPRLGGAGFARLEPPGR
jgi:hypothetical protein